MVFDGPRGKKDYVKTSFCFLTLSADPKRTDILRSPKGMPFADLSIAGTLIPS